MPVAADITVKKADGTTNVVYTLITSAGGDKSPALFRQNAAVGTIGQKPYLSVASRWNGDKSARRVEGTFVFPSVYTNTATGTTEVRAKAVGQFSIALPMDMLPADTTEVGPQFGNLLASAIVAATNSSGFAPT